MACHAHTQAHTSRRIGLLVKLLQNHKDFPAAEAFGLLPTPGVAPVVSASQR